MITGTTKLFYMIADPIEHVRTPEVMNPLFQTRGIDAVMVPLHVGMADLPRAWETFRQSRNLGGMVISVPLKERALRLSDEASEDAREMGVANVVRRDANGRMVATNLDGQGFVMGMLGGGAEAKGRHALLVGAGGAGRAIAMSLAKQGVASLRLFDTDAERADALRDEVAALRPELPIETGSRKVAGCDLVVNATPLGLHPETDPLPLDVASLRPGMLVLDIVMKPRDTPLLRAAASAGCEVRYGDGMLDAQIELMVQFFGY